MGRDPLQVIPGVGPSIARDLRALGITRVEQLRGRNPERLYAQSNMLCGMTQDRCLLYAFRCAVYYASEPRPELRLLKWWNWSDKNLAAKVTTARTGQRTGRRGSRPRRPSRSPKAATA